VRGVRGGFGRMAKHMVPSVSARVNPGVGRFRSKHD